MLDQTQLDPRMALWSRRREDLELWIRKVASLLPNVEHVLNTR